MDKFSVNAWFDYYVQTMASTPLKAIGILGFLNKLDRHKQAGLRRIQSTCRLHNKRDSKETSSDSRELATSEDLRKIFEKEFPNHFNDGKFVSRMSYVEFIDEALAKSKELGVEKNLNTYKELLKVFPPGKYWPSNRFEFGLFHAPQQLAAVRVLFQMESVGLKPDKEFEKLVINAFSKKSEVWNKIARMNYWSMKGRNIDPNPLPEVLPKKPHQLAKLALARMLDDHKSLITITNTTQLPDCVDKTWIAFSQSPTQKAILDRLDEKSTLYIEEGGLAFVGDQYLSYYLLKHYVDDETLKQKIQEQNPPPDHNYNTLKMKFYGKPIREKIKSLEDKHYVDGCYILAIGITGTSSQDSLLSWLKILQQRNPNLSKLNVVFKMSKPSPEMIEYNQAQQHNENTNKTTNQQQSVS